MSLVNDLKYQANEGLKKTKISFDDYILGMNHIKNKIKKTEMEIENHVKSVKKFIYLKENKKYLIDFYPNYQKEFDNFLNDFNLEKSNLEETKKNQIEMDITLQAIQKKYSENIEKIAVLQKKLREHEKKLNKYDKNEKDLYSKISSNNAQRLIYNKIIDNAQLKNFSYDINAENWNLLEEKIKLYEKNKKGLMNKIKNLFNNEPEYVNFLKIEKQLKKHYDKETFIPSLELFFMENFSAINKSMQYDEDFSEIKSEKNKMILEIKRLNKEIIQIDIDNQKRKISDMKKKNDEYLSFISLFENTDTPEKIENHIQEKTIKKLENHLIFPQFNETYGNELTEYIEKNEKLLQQLNFLNKLNENEQKNKMVIEKNYHTLRKNYDTILRLQDKTKINDALRIKKITPDMVKQSGENFTKALREKNTKNMNSQNLNDSSFSDILIISASDGLMDGLLTGITDISSVVSEAASSCSSAPSSNCSSSSCSSCGGGD